MTKTFFWKGKSIEHDPWVARLILLEVSQYQSTTTNHRINSCVLRSRTYISVPNSRYKKPTYPPFGTNEHLPYPIYISLPFQNFLIASLTRSAPNVAPAP